MYSHFYQRNYKADQSDGVNGKLLSIGRDNVCYSSEGRIQWIGDPVGKTLIRRIANRFKSKIA